MIFDNGDLTKDTKITRNEANELITYYESIDIYWNFTDCNWNKKTKMKNISIKNRKTKEVITFYDLYKRYKVEKKITPEQNKLIYQSRVYKEAFTFIFSSFLFYFHCSNILHYYPFFGNHRVNKSDIKTSIKESLSNASILGHKAIQGFQSGGSIYKQNKREYATPPFFIYGCSGIFRFLYGFLNDEIKLKYKDVFNDLHKYQDDEEIFPYSPYFLTPTSKKHEDDNNKNVFDIEEIINDTNFIENLMNFALFKSSYENKNEMKEFQIDEFDKNNIIKSILLSFCAFNKITSQYLNTAFLAPHRFTFYIYRNFGGKIINRWLCENIALTPEEKEEKTFKNTIVFWFAFILFFILSFILLLFYLMMYSFMYSIVFICSIICIISLSFKTFIPVIKGIKSLLIKLYHSIQTSLKTNIIPNILHIPFSIGIMFMIAIFSLPIAIVVFIFAIFITFISMIVYSILLLCNIHISVFDNFFVPQSENTTPDNKDNDVINKILSKLKWVLTFIVIVYNLLSLDSKHILAPYLYNIKKSLFSLVIFFVSIIYFYYKSKTWNHINEQYKQKVDMSDERMLPFLSLDYYIRDDSKRLFNLNTEDKPTFCNYEDSGSTQTGGAPRVKRENMSSGLKYGVGSIVSLPMIAFMKGLFFEIFKSK